MIAQQQMPVVDVTSDADLRALIAAYRALWTAVGLVQTTDTGQLNPATIARATVATVFHPSFEIWRFDDALQATSPIFIKVQYSYNVSNVYHAPTVGLTVATATNGAGGLTGLVGPLMGIPFDPRTLAPRDHSLIATTGDGSRLSLLTAWNPSAPRYYFYTIERTRDASGHPTADGIFAGAQTTNVLLNVGVAAGPTRASMPFIDPAFAGRTSYGQDISICPAFVAVNGKPFSLMTVAHSGQSDFPVGALFTIPHLGANRDYLSLGGFANYLMTPQVGGGFAIPWD